MRRAIRATPVPTRRSAGLRLAGLVLPALLAGCSGLYGVRIGPPDLDTRSPAAPRCGVVTYPARELMTSNRGDVIVRVHVDAQGRVTDAALDTPSEHDALNQVALDAAARQCRFEPAPPAAGGTTRTVRITFVFDFIARPGQMDWPVVRVGIQPGLQPTTD